MTVDVPEAERPLSVSDSGVAVPALLPFASRASTFGASLVAALVNSVFGLTFTLYSIAPLVWLFIGWISAESLKSRRVDEREVITI